MRRLTTEEFITKAVQVHGKRYDYSNVSYISAKQPIIIICKKHGRFKQNPTNHLQRKGCRNCSIATQIQKQSKTTQDFIRIASNIHRNKYDYSNVNYKNWRTKVEITCPEHGAFFQTPNNHTSNSNCNGCPKCRPKGDEHYNWKGGITPINDKIRKSRKYKRWRNFIFKRDNYTCSSCDVRGGNLNAHHIKSFSKFPEDRFNVDNGTTLCLSCHKMTGNYGRRNI